MGSRKLKRKSNPGYKVVFPSHNVALCSPYSLGGPFLLPSQLDVLTGIC